MLTGQPAEMRWQVQPEAQRRPGKVPPLGVKKDTGGPYSPAGLNLKGESVFPVKSHAGS